MKRKEDFVLKNIINKINNDRENQITTIEEATIEEVEMIISEIEEVLAKQAQLKNKIKENATKENEIKEEETKL